MSKKPEIIFEDDKLIVVNKPAGFLSIPGRNNPAPSILEIYREKKGDLYPVHRLDIDTSGLLLLAKNLSIHKELNTLFEQRKIVKNYLAVTKGTPKQHQGEITEGLQALDHKTLVSKHGKEAYTSYEVIEGFRQYAYLKVNIKTGRRHQIRAHLAHMHCPVLCDDLYGDGQPFLLSSIKKKYNNRSEERPLISRTALHAHDITFQLSDENIERSYVAEIPKDMRALLNQLRKNAE